MTDDALNERLALARELDARLAAALFGWRWYLQPTQDGVERVALWPPRAPGYVRWNLRANAVDVTGREREYERSADWDRVGNRCDLPINSGVPHYSSTGDGMLAVLEALKQQPGVFGRFEDLVFFGSPDYRVEPHRRAKAENSENRVGNQANLRYP